MKKMNLKESLSKTKRNLSLFVFMIILFVISGAVLTENVTFTGIGDILPALTGSSDSTSTTISSATSNTSGTSETSPTNTSGNSTVTSDTSATSLTTTPSTNSNTETTTSIAVTEPTAPTELSLQNSGTPLFGTITIKWKDNSNNETLFKIEKKINSISSFSPITYTSPNVTEYVDPAVAPGYYYDYRVQACVEGAGCSSFAYLYKVTPKKEENTITDATTTNTTNTTTITTTPITPTTDKETDVLIVPLPTIALPTIPLPVLPPLPVQLTQKITNLEEEKTTVPIYTATEVSDKINNLSTIVEERREVVEQAKEKLIRFINENVAEIVKTAEAGGQKVDTARIRILQNRLIEMVNSSLFALTDISSVDIKNLKSEINAGIANIKAVIGENTIGYRVSTTDEKNIEDTLDKLSASVDEQVEILKDQDSTLLYKDTNRDGISDYDSIYIYNIHPTNPSPVSDHEGRKLNASEKILLGFDPTKNDLVPIRKEEPVKSEAPVLFTYQIKEVALTEKREVVLKGQALPNSFVTLYIYSTPIIVTVKTDSKGEWKYVLDKELENGDHTIYTATVNNSGNIVAKSSPYLFTKTAEAVTLRDLPALEASTGDSKPRLLEGNDIYVAVGMIVVFIIMILTLIGMTSRKTPEINQ